MADDGMLMNFELGSGPLKPQTKFTGGKWRDRKRAERNARLSSAGKPDAPAAGRDSTDHDDGSRSFKRPRLGHEGPGRNFSHTSSSSDPRKRAPRENGPASGGASKDQRGPGFGNRQVVSKLFSFNPEQKTVFEDELEWEAPKPSNAPLLDVASFGSLTISSRLVDELGKMSLERPTAIQQKVLPHLLSTSSDAFVQAETGSGKTFAYLLPILHRVLLLSGGGDGKQVHRDSGVFAIIVAPTRELAKQTHTVLEKLIRPFPWLVSTAITGGESKKAEKARIRKGINFLVATPGRLADHIDNTKALNLGTVRWLVLDEGDRLMDLGFEEDLKKAIDALKKVEVAKTTPSGVSLDALPDRRVTVLCSATMKMNVQKLGEMSLADAVFLAAEKGEAGSDESNGNSVNKQVEEPGVHKAPSQLHQSHIIVPSKLRLVTLMAYLKSVFSRRGHTMKAIIFMSCADTVDFHYELLRTPGDAELPPSASKDAENTAKTVCKASYITSMASPEVILHRMHGSLSQPIRTATLRSFSDCKSPSLLITTDVSSRGLDIPSVDLVIEYDPAFSFADHIHRIGRTARAGRSGDAVIFLLPGSEEGYIELLRASGSPTAVSYDSVLKKGLMAKMEFPVETTSAPAEGQSYLEKAETLQLHLEQRLLNDAKRLEMARNGFKSHIRAYATHVREERVHFDITALHLGHVAKSYGLRDPPGGIGAGIERKRKGAKGARGGAGASSSSSSSSSGKGSRKDDDDEDKKDFTEDQAQSNRKMLRMKSKMLTSGASEFNLG